MTQVRWGLFWDWQAYELESYFYEEVHGYEAVQEVWSMEVAGDNIMHMGVLI